MKLRQHEIDEAISLFNNQKLLRKDIRRYMVGNSMLLACAWFMSKFSIVFLIIALGFIGGFTGGSINLIKSAKEKKYVIAFYQVFKWSTFSVSFLMISINTILFFDSGIEGMALAFVVGIVYGLTLFISLRTVKGDKNKDLEVKDDTYRSWKSAGTSLGIIVFWLARGGLSDLSQKEAILFIILGSVYVSFAIIPNAKRAYRLYLEWKEE